MLFGGERNILLRPDVLDPDYLPDQLPGRERELEDIADVLSYVVEAKTSENVFVTGPPGTGKTAVMRYVLREFTRHYSDVFASYVNCWMYRTRFALAAKLAQELGIPSPRRGVAPDEIYERVYHKLGEFRAVVIVLDEADRLLTSQEMLYDLARLGTFADVPHSIVTISNTPAFLSRLDPRILSSLFRRRVEFSPYTVPQLKQILSERAELALAPTSYDDEVLGLCAAVGWKRGGDARVAISCLYEAARIAEREGDRILVEHVKRAEGMLFPTTVADPKLTPILSLLREHGPMTVKQLYDLYRERNPVTLRAFRNYLKELEAVGEIIIERAPVRGHVRVVRLARNA